MGSDEILVLDYLKQFGQSFTDPWQVCAKASTEARYESQPEWALPVLVGLRAAGHVETNEFGHYRITIALLTRYLDLFRGGQRLDLGCNAVAQRIVQMAPGDDEKTFNDLIREALEVDLTPKHQ